MIFFFSLAVFEIACLRSHTPCTLNDLKDVIRQEIRPFDRLLLARVMDDFKRRLENCIQEEGRRPIDIIFET